MSRGPGAGPNVAPGSALALCADLLLAALVTGCGGTDADGGTSVRDSAGVTIVENRQGERRLDWRFRPVARIGSASGEDALFRIGRHRVDAGPRDRVYVLDGGSHRVLVHGPEGERIRTLGGEGRGPGEIGRPGALSVSPEGDVLVLDATGPTLMRWSPEGRLDAERPVEIGGEEGLRIRPDGERLEAGPAGTALTQVQGSRSVTSDSILRGVARVGSEGEGALLQRVWRPRSAIQDYGCVRINLPPLFRAEITWDAAGGRMAYARGAEYSVEVFEAGELVRIVRREVAPVPTSEEMALAEVGDGIRVRHPGGQCSVDPEELVEKRGYAPQLPAVDGVALAPDGGLWVRRPTGSDAAAVDVFDPSGRYRGTLPEGSVLPAAFISADTAVLSRRDSLGVERVEVVEVIRR